MKSLFQTLNKTAILLVWLFIGVFASQGPLPTMMLCIGADGHVEIEAAHDGRCASFLTATHKRSSDFLPAYQTPPIQAHCGQCLDLPIFISSAEGPYIVPIPKNALQCSTQVIMPLTATQPTLVSIPTDIFLPNSHPKTNSTLASLRTVTLLI